MSQLPFPPSILRHLTEHAGRRPERAPHPTVAHAAEKPEPVEPVAFRCLACGSHAVVAVADTPRHA